MKLPGRRTASKNARSTWQDNRPDWSANIRARRYVHIPEIDRWRAVPFDMPPPPERGTVRQRVRQITESLEGAIDEGTGAALDRLINSWVVSWIATVEAEYTDHCGVIDVHRGQAAQWLAESTYTARHENDELKRIREAYLACRARLSGEPRADHLSSQHADISGEMP
jgi:hypothetical protein